MIEYDPRGWLSIVLPWKGSVLRGIAGRVLTAAAMGAVAAWASQARHIRISSVAHAMIGIALGLLLVFRTNASYERFWEGRKAFGAMVNRARDLVRQIKSFVDDQAVADELRRWVVALVALVIQSLRQETDMDPIARLLPPEERNKLERCTTRNQRQARAKRR